MTQLNLEGKTVGRFEILSRLGGGGMGVVYKARQANLERIVALKILPPQLMHDESYVKRFQQEARNAARLEHPHIVPIFEIGELVVPPDTSATTPLPPLHFIAMKYIPGETLKDYMKRQGALGLEHTLEILTQVGGALDYAHRHEVIHRDIKPSNIMMTDEEWVYLTDFGLARGMGATTELTQTGMVLGTPEYMSPEQAQGLPDIGAATDIYALGIVLYEMLTADLPFEADTPMAMVAARLMHTPRPLRNLRNDMPLAVEDVVMRALARAPEERFDSVAEMIEALRAAVEAEKQARATYAFPTTTGPTISLPQQQPPPPPPEERSSAGDRGDEDDPSSYPPEPPVRGKHGKGTFPFFLIPIFVVLAVFGPKWFKQHDDPSPPPSPPQTRELPPTTENPILPPLPSEATMIEDGWEFFNRGQYEQAEQVFREVLEQNPRSTEALNGLGWSLTKQEDYPDSYNEAISMFDESLDIEEKQAVAENGLGWSYYKLQDYKQAQKHFREATKLDKKYVNAYYGLGRALEDEGKLGQAVKAYKDALKIKTKNPEEMKEQEEIRGVLERLDARRR